MNEFRNKLERARPGPTGAAVCFWVLSPVVRRTDDLTRCRLAAGAQKTAGDCLKKCGALLREERKRVERDEIVSGCGCACAAESKVASWQPPSRSHRRLPVPVLVLVSASNQLLQRAPIARVGPNAAAKCRFRPPGPPQHDPRFANGILCRPTLRFPFARSSTRRSGAFSSSSTRVWPHSCSLSARERWINFLFVPIDERRESCFVACFSSEEERIAFCSLRARECLSLKNLLLPVYNIMRACEIAEVGLPPPVCGRPIVMGLQKIDLRYLSLREAAEGIISLKCARQSFTQADEEGLRVHNCLIREIPLESQPQGSAHRSYCVQESFCPFPTDFFFNTREQKEPTKSRANFAIHL